MVFDKLSTLLFGPSVRGSKVRGLYALRYGELALNLNEDILSQIISTPEPFDDSQRTALQDKISAYEAAQRENSANQRSLHQEYETMQLPEVISKALITIKESGEDRKARHLYIASMYKVGHIQRAIQKRSELRSAGESDTKDLISKVEKAIMDEMRHQDSYFLYCGCFFRQSFSVVEMICSMEDPTVEAVVQRILDTEPACQEALKQKQADLSSRYSSVEGAMNKAQVNGHVSKALEESRDKELRRFKEENEPFITSYDLLNVRHELLYIDPQNKQYESEEKRLKSEADSIEQARRPRLNLMNLTDGDINYTLEKVYSQEQRTTSFEGRVKLRHPDSCERQYHGMHRHRMEDSVHGRHQSLEASAIDVLSQALIGEGLQVVNKNGSLVIDNVATLSLDFNHHEGSGRYSDRINYRSNLGQSDVDSLRNELVRTQKVFQIAGREIKNLTDVHQYR